VDYAREIQTAFKPELRNQPKSESTLYLYQDANGKTCHGHITQTKGTSPEAAVPGILFFYTGAGSHDMCLHWKADSLVANSEVFPNGCIILITNILGDNPGWVWSPNRTKYNAARHEVLGIDNNAVYEGTLMSRLEQVFC
jgi:hypothetical protein